MNKYSYFAKLLSQEGVDLEYKDVSTAYFNFENRNIVLPIKNKFDEEISELFVVHECAHARYSNYTLDEVDTYFKSFGDVFNIVEDFYIEKALKKDFKGTENILNEGYDKLFKSGMFADKDVLEKIVNDTSKEYFVNKVLIATKLGKYFKQIEFNTVEEKLIAEVKSVKSNDDVVEICRKINEYLEDDENDENNNENSSDNQENSSENNNENSENSESSSENLDDIKKSSILRELEKNINFQSENKKSYSFKKDLFFATSFKNMTEITYNISKSKELFEIFYDIESLDDVELERIFKMVKKTTKSASGIFKSKQSAKNLSTEKRKKTGSLNMNALHKYKFSENIFIQKKYQENQENHSVVILVDTSGSIREILNDIIIQTATAAELCKTLGIKFNIVFFGLNTNIEFIKKFDKNLSKKNMNDIVDYELFLDSLTMEFADETTYSLKALIGLYKELKSGNLIYTLFKKKDMIKNDNIRKFLNESEEKNKRGYFLSTAMTPTSDGIVASMKIIKKHKELGIDKTNLIIITDGQPTCSSSKNSYLNDFIDNNRTTPLNVIESLYIEKGVSEYYTSHLNKATKSDNNYEYYSSLSKIKIDNKMFDVENEYKDYYNNEFIKQNNICNFDNYYENSLLDYLKKLYNTNICYSIVEKKSCPKSEENFKYFMNHIYSKNANDTQTGIFNTFLTNVALSKTLSEKEKEKIIINAYYKSYNTITAEINLPWLDSIMYTCKEKGTNSNLKRKIINSTANDKDKKRYNQEILAENINKLKKYELYARHIANVIA